MIQARRPYPARSLAAAQHQPAQTSAEREARLLLTAYVGVCAVVAVVPILMVVMTAWGIGGLGWWLLS